MEPTPRTRPDGPTLVALLGATALLLLALGRAAMLEVDFYDAYECRLAGRTLVGSADWAGFPLYRSPLFVLACAAGEALGAGWRAPLLLSVAGYAALLAGSGLLALRLGAPTWLAALLALLVGLDRLAFLYAPHGLPDVAAAGACALALATAAAPGDGPWPARPVRLGLLIGLAALCRPNAGLIAAALCATAVPIPRPKGGALVPPAPLWRAALAAAVGAGLYLVATTALFSWARGGLGAGVAAHAELARLQAEQVAENRLRYGPMTSWTDPLVALLVASPALLLPALTGLAAAAREPRAAGRAPLAWVIVHLLFLSLVAGHSEARYGLPALPALAGLAALGLPPALGAIARRAPRLAPALPWALLAALPGAALLLGAPYEARRLLDPVHRSSFAARVAREAEALAGPEGRFLYTTTHPYGVYPRVMVDPGTPYPGDPVHGILHLGPRVLGYHLGRPVAQVPPERGAGLRDPAELLAFVRGQPGFREGDVLLVGEPRPCLTWTIAAAPPGPFGLARVRARGGALELEWRWLDAGEPPR